MSIQKIKGGLICSCQPLDKSPTNSEEFIVAMAHAAIIAEARGLRIEGVQNIKAVRKALPDAFIIGIVKRDLNDSPVRITPFVEDVLDICDAGADVVAVDGTNRKRPVEIAKLLETIKSKGKIAMADCSCLDDGKFCANLGFEIIGTTLSGYTENSPATSDQPDFELLKNFVDLGFNVMAEGRYNTPELAQKAIKMGALAVTVGTAITRLETICSWFVSAIEEK